MACDLTLGEFSLSGGLVPRKVQISRPPSEGESSNNDGLPMLMGWRGIETSSDSAKTNKDQNKSKLRHE